MFTGIIQEIGKVKEIIRGKNYKLTISCSKINRSQSTVHSPQNLKLQISNHKFYGEQGRTTQINSNNQIPNSQHSNIPSFHHSNSPIQLGESIAVDGVCLTVVHSPQSTVHSNQFPIPNSQSPINTSHFPLPISHFTVDVMEETVKRTTISQYFVGREVNLERAIRADGRFGGHFVQGHIDGVGEIIKTEIKQNSKILTFRLPKDLTSYIVEKGSIAIDGISLTIASISRNEGQFTVSLIPFTLTNTTIDKKKTTDKVNIEFDIIGKYVVSYLKNLKFS